MFVEVVGKVLQFAPVAGEAGQLGKDQAADVAALNVLHHSFGLGMLHDGLAALAGQIIHFLDLPAPTLGVLPGAFFVMFGAVPLCLVFG